MPPERTGLFPYAVDVDGFRDRSSLSPVERRGAAGAAGSAGRRTSGPRRREAQRPRGPLGPPAAQRPACRTTSGSCSPGTARIGPRSRASRASTASRGCASSATCPTRELPALYAASDLFVHAAREERWGVSVQEALACGLPVVASSRVGAARDLRHRAQWFHLSGRRRHRSRAEDRRGAAPRSRGGAGGELGRPRPLGLQGHLAGPLAVGQENVMRLTPRTFW